MSERWEIRDCGYESPCWVWLTNIDRLGYAHCWINSRSQLAHRVMYEMHVGPIPEGLTLDHLCRTRACVNPTHLEPVTLRENVLRGASVAAKNAVKTHCPQGHPYDEENTRWTEGRRRCRQCLREKARARYRKMSS